MHPTLILRHKKENLKKCSLTGLETRKDLKFYSYPLTILPPLENYVILSVEGSLLSSEDHDKGLILIDGTWKYAASMLAYLEKNANLEKRRLPSFKTAYPRKQTLCPLPEEGLASVEALFLAHYLMGKSTEGLLDFYYWKELFLNKNQEALVTCNNFINL